MDLKTQIQTFFSDIKDVLQLIAPICAFIGLVGAGAVLISGWLNWKNAAG